MATCPKCGGMAVPEQELGRWHCQLCWSWLVQDAYTGQLVPWGEMPAQPAARKSRLTWKLLAIVVAVALIAVVVAAALLYKPAAVALTSNCTYDADIQGNIKWIKGVFVRLTNGGVETADGTKIVMRYSGTNIVPEDAAWLGGPVPPSKEVMTYYSAETGASAFHVADPSAELDLHISFSYDGKAMDSCRAA